MTLLLSVAVGLAAGFVSGLFGVGGGIVIVPGLVLLIRLSQHFAAGTSVATIVASSGAALLVLAGDGSVDWAAAAVLFIGAGTGAWIATKVAHRIPEYALAAVFTAVMVVAAVRMWVSG